MAKKFANTNPTFGLATASIDLDRVTNPDFPEINKVPLADIHPNPNQPRKIFDEADLAGLAASIDAHGLKQPILIRRRAEGGYMLVAGERRFRAHQLLGRDNILAIIVSDRDDVEVTALVENLQRVDLTPVESGRGLVRLQERALAKGEKLTQEDLAHFIGKSQSEVTRLLNIVKLPSAVLVEYEAIHKDVSKSALSELLGIDDEAVTMRLWGMVKDGASVAELRKAKAASRADDNAAPKPAIALRAAPIERVRKQWRTMATSLSKQEIRTEDLSADDVDDLRRLRDAITGIIGG